jgi:hypothetical protein
VPDWSDKATISAVAMWDEEDATGLSKPFFRISKDNRLLTLQGKIIDTIGKSSTAAYPNFQCLRSLPDEAATYSARKQEVSTLQEWLDQFGGSRRKNMKVFFTEFAHNAWIRTGDASYLESSALVDYWVRGIRSLDNRATADYDLLKRVSRFIKIDHLLDINNVKKNINPFHTIIRKLCDRKKMFQTDLGNLGVGCRSLCVGDKIALFSVRKTPWVHAMQILTFLYRAAVFQ